MSHTEPTNEELGIVPVIGIKTATCICSVIGLGCWYFIFRLLGVM